MYKSIFIVISAMILNSCSHAQNKSTNNRLSAVEVAAKIKENPNFQLLDVRTPAEYEKGHIAGAINANINGKHFEDQVSALDQTQPVFVYCLSGGRSSAAVKQLRATGFKNVVEMPGGMMEWRAKNLPETEGANVAKGMSLAQYENLLKSDKLVLVDFYADWCAPCKEMKPYLDKISTEMADKVMVVRIDADANMELCKALKIDALPVLKLYKNEKLVWDNLGFVDEATVREKLK